MNEPIKRYNKLGGRTFYVFAAKYANIILATIILSGLIIYGLNFLPEDLQSFTAPISYGVIGFGLAIILMAMISAWLAYSHYRIEIYNDFLKITRGVFVIEEVGVPYKRIVEIKVHRSLAEHMIGLANIRIVVFREDDKRTPQNESIIILPALTNAIATDIQHNILERTNIHDITAEEPVPTV